MAECDSVGAKQLSRDTFDLEVGGSSTALCYCVVSFACILMETTTPDRTPWDT